MQEIEPKNKELGALLDAPCPHIEVRRGDQLIANNPTVNPKKFYCLGCGRLTGATIGGHRNELDDERPF